MNGFGRRDQIGCRLDYNTDGWIRSIEQYARVVCINVNNGQWSRKWLDSVMVCLVEY